MGVNLRNYDLKQNDLLVSGGNLTYTVVGVENDEVTYAFVPANSSRRTVRIDKAGLNIHWVQSVTRGGNTLAPKLKFGQAIKVNGVDAVFLAQPTGKTSKVALVDGAVMTVNSNSITA